MWALLRFKERLVKVLMDINIAKDVKGGVSSQNVVSHLCPACLQVHALPNLAHALPNVVQALPDFMQLHMPAAVSCLMCVQLAAAGAAVQPHACAAMPLAYTRFHRAPYTCPSRLPAKLSRHVPPCATCCRLLSQGSARRSLPAQARQTERMELPCSGCSPCAHDGRSADAALLRTMQAQVD